MSKFRRRLMTMANIFIPPYDYLSPYLQSRGNSYIELPIYASEDTDAIEITFQLDELNPQTRFFAPDGGETVFQAFVSANDRVGVAVNNTFAGDNAAQPLTTGVHKLLIDYPNRRVTLDDTKTITIANSTATASTYLEILKPFAKWPKFHGKLFSVKLWRNGTLKHDMVPAVLEREGYMFCNKTKRLYGNLGVSPFGFGGHTYDADGKLRLDADGKYLDVIINNNTDYIYGD